MHRIPVSLAAIMLGGALCVPPEEAHSSSPSARPDLQFNGVVLNVSDLARSEKFYTEVFGLERVLRLPPKPARGRTRGCAAVPNHVCDH